MDSTNNTPRFALHRRKCIVCCHDAIRISHQSKIICILQYNGGWRASNHCNASRSWKHSAKYYHGFERHFKSKPQSHGETTNVCLKLWFYRQIDSVNAWTPCNVTLSRIEPVRVDEQINGKSDKKKKVCVQQVSMRVQKMGVYATTAPHKAQRSNDVSKRYATKDNLDVKCTKYIDD